MYSVPSASQSRQPEARSTIRCGLSRRVLLLTPPASAWSARRCNMCCRPVVDTLVICASLADLPDSRRWDRREAGQPQAVHLDGVNPEDPICLRAVQIVQCCRAAFRTCP